MESCIPRYHKYLFHHVTPLVKSCSWHNFLPQQVFFSFLMCMCVCVCVCVAKTIYTGISPPNSYHQTLFMFFRTWRTQGTMSSHLAGILSLLSHLKHSPTSPILKASCPSASSSDPSLISYSTAAAKSLQSCPTLCDPIDGSPPGSPVPGIL